MLKRIKRFPFQIILSCQNLQKTFCLTKTSHNKFLPISAYLFIIALEIIFAMIKSNPNLKGHDIFNHNYLYIAYADDTSFKQSKIN